MFARLGHVVFILAYIATALIVLVGIVIIGWSLVANGADLLASIDGRNWSPVWSWLINQAIVAGITVLIAAVVFLIGLAICYVLGGFSTTVADQTRKISN